MENWHDRGRVLSTVRFVHRKYTTLRYLHIEVEQHSLTVQANCLLVSVRSRPRQQEFSTSCHYPLRLGEIVKGNCKHVSLHFVAFKKGKYREWKANATSMPKCHRRSFYLNRTTTYLLHFSTSDIEKSWLEFCDIYGVSLFHIRKRNFGKF